MDPNTSGFILLILIGAAILAFPTSIVLMYFYRRAVIHSMRSYSQKKKVDPDSYETSAIHKENVSATLAFNYLNERFSNFDKSPSNVLYNDLLYGPWRAVSIYIIAGVCYAVIATIIFYQSAELEYYPLQFFLYFWIHIWPLVFIINIIIATSWRKIIVFTFIYFFVYFLFATIAFTLPQNQSVWMNISESWIAKNSPTILLLFFLIKRIRAVGPLVLAFMLLAVTGLNLITYFSNIDERVRHFFFEIGNALGLSPLGIHLSNLLLGFVIFGCIGWLMLLWIRHRYEQKKLSDQSITIDAIWMLFIVFNSIDLIPYGLFWFLLGLSTFLVYKAIVWIGFSLMKNKLKDSPYSPKLLLLRVFALGKKSERLFDQLTLHWRYIGSIWLIAGPDLATTTIKPYEFLDFLSRKLSRRFIKDLDTLNRRLEEADLTPDQDGRFRINDFFCYENTWRMVLPKLLHVSDVILMDLRGFTSLRSGCIFEIETIMKLVHLEKVIFLVDEATDEQFLQQTIEQSCYKMHENSLYKRSISEKVNLVKVEGIDDHTFQKLFSALCEAVNHKEKITGNNEIAKIDSESEQY